MKAAGRMVLFVVVGSAAGSKNFTYPLCTKKKTKKKKTLDVAFFAFKNNYFSVDVAFYGRKTI